MHRDGVDNLISRKTMTALSFLAYRQIILRFEDPSTNGGVAARGDFHARHDIDPRLTNPWTHLIQRFIR